MAKRVTRAPSTPACLKAGVEHTGNRAVRRFRIVVGHASDWDDAAADEVFIVCPWLEGLDPQSGLWLSALPIHDCNAFLEGDWTLLAPEPLRQRCHIGVFALDRLRASRQIFAALSDKGARGIINLPSIGFFDGATAQTFGRLAFTLESEIAFLMQARSFGLGVALCAPSTLALPEDRAAPFDFILRQSGPDQPLAIEETQPR